MEGHTMAYRYPPLARKLHWATAVLVAIMIVLGFWITWFEPKNEALKFALYDVHESTGALLFVLVFARLARRISDPPTLLPPIVPKVFRAAAQANHLLLYAMLLLQPVLGFLATNAWGFPFRWARLLPIPSPLGKDQALAPVLSDLHLAGAVLLLLLIGAHLGGAFFHGLIRRDGVVQRML
jgi:cytochrome b561